MEAPLLSSWTRSSQLGNWVDRPVIYWSLSNAAEGTEYLAEMMRRPPVLACQGTPPRAYGVDRLIIRGLYSTQGRPWKFGFFGTNSAYSTGAQIFIDGKIDRTELRPFIAAH